MNETPRVRRPAQDPRQHFKEDATRPINDEEFLRIVISMLGAEPPDPALQGHLDGAFFARRAKRRASGNGQPWAVKRAVDVLISVIAAIVLAPLLLITAIAVKLEGNGPILYRSARVGRGGEHFQYLKFRTLYPQPELNSSSTGGSPDDYANDPRITPLGRLLRRFSIDELPALANVFRGQMSLVGPRPLLEVEFPLAQGESLDFLTVRPGLTGLWQVSGSYDLTYQDQIRLANSYARRWSLGLDAIIMWKTALAVFAGSRYLRSRQEPLRSI